MKRVGESSKETFALAAGVLVAVAVMIHSDRALAGSGGAFVGGLVGGVVLTKAMDNDRRRTEAAEAQAYRQQQPQVVYQQAPDSGSGGKSAEERLDELDSLAAKGYINQDEYQRRRQEILDSL